MRQSGARRATSVASRTCGTQRPAAPASQLCHWTVAPPPVSVPGVGLFRQFAAAFYPPTYQGELDPAMISVESWPQADGTVVRRISEGGQLCVEEKWGTDTARLELAAPAIAELRLMVRRNPLFESAAGARAAADAIGVPDAAAGFFPLVAAGLAAWVRVRDTRPMAGLRVCLPAGSPDDVTSVTVLAWNLPWGAIEFELRQGGVVIGQAVAALSCGPRKHR